MPSPSLPRDASDARSGAAFVRTESAGCLLEEVAEGSQEEWKGMMRLLLQVLLGESGCVMRSCDLQAGVILLLGAACSLGTEAHGETALAASDSGDARDRQLCVFQVCDKSGS